MENENKELRFHITIKDNKTGETLLDSDACAIIGGVNKGGSTVTLASVSGNAEDYAQALASAEEVAEIIREKHPELGDLADFIRVSRKLSN